MKTRHKLVQYNNKNTTPDYLHLLCELKLNEVNGVKCAVSTVQPNGKLKLETIT